MLHESIKTAASAALFCGVLASLGFAPVGVSLFLMLGLMGLMGLLKDAKSFREAAAIGFFWGVGYFSPGLAWTEHSMTVYGGLPLAVSLLGVLALASFLSLFIVLFSVGSYFFRGKKIWLLSLWMPPLWAILEWLRGDVMTSFGWLSVGYSFTENFLATCAPLGGVYAVSFVVVFVCGSVVALLGEKSFKHERAKLALLFGCVVLASYFGSDFSWSQPRGRLEVRLVQPDLAVTTRASYAKQSANLDRVETMSLASPMGAALDWILWPESVYLVSRERLPDGMRTLPERISAKTGATVLYNVFEEPERMRFFNSLLLTSGTKSESLYSKRHLVPFGEYVPFGFRWFVDALKIPMADQSRGTDPKAAVRLSDVPVALGICYENLFASELRDWFQSEDVPSVVLFSANLGWFTSSALRQFTQISQMRARETARPVVQVVNNGYSAYILPTGKIDRLAQGGAQNLDVTVRPCVGSLTPLMRYGFTPSILFYLLILLGLFFSDRRRF